MSDRSANVASYLLDTTVIIDYLRGHAEVRARLHHLTEQQHELAVCAISVAEVFAGLRGEDLQVAIAAITLPNAGSVALHERIGFTLAGVMHDVGRKFDRYWDVAWYEKRLAD